MVNLFFKTRKKFKQWKNFSKNLASIKKLSPSPLHWVLAIKKFACRWGVSCACEVVDQWTPVSVINWASQAYIISVARPMSGVSVTIRLLAATAAAAFNFFNQSGARRSLNRTLRCCGKRVFLVFSSLGVSGPTCSGMLVKMLLYSTSARGELFIFFYEKKVWVIYLLSKLDFVFKLKIVQKIFDLLETSNYLRFIGRLSWLTPIN